MQVETFNQTNYIQGFTHFEHGIKSNQPETVIFELQHYRIYSEEFRDFRKTRKKEKFIEF